MTDEYDRHVEDFHRSSIRIIGHDHWADEEHLLAMPHAGLTAKVLHVSVDARVWSDAADREKSLHEYSGFTATAMAEIERILGIIKDHPESLLLARSASDIRHASESGKSALVLGFEGGKPIEKDLGLLRMFHGLGLRVLQLTWAGGNDICDRRDPPVCEGLTDFGRAVVQEMNRLGIVIDPGHCSRKTFLQVVDLSSQPVALLHTTPSGAKPGAGNLDDRQIQAVAETGGVIGLHFFSHFLNPWRKASVEDLVDHVEYIANLVGIQHVALGGDFLNLSEEFIRGHGMPPSGFLGIPEEFDSYDKLINITKALCRRGFSDEDVRKVLGGNLLRLFQAVFGG